MNRLAAAFCALLLAGCASLQHAGNSSYSVAPIVTEKGAVICCRVDVRDGKERASLSLHVVKQGDNYTVDLVEQGVEAFAGQKIAAGASEAAAKTAGKVAASAALAPVLPALLPAAGAALASPGIGAAAVGAGAVILNDKVSP